MKLSFLRRPALSVLPGLIIIGIAISGGATESASATSSYTPLCATSSHVREIGANFSSYGHSTAPVGGDRYNLTGATSSTDLTACSALTVTTSQAAVLNKEYYLNFSAASLANTDLFDGGNSIMFDITGTPEAGGFRVLVLDTATTPATLLTQTAGFTTNFSYNTPLLPTSNPTVYSPTSGSVTSNYAYTVNAQQKQDILQGHLVIYLVYVGAGMPTVAAQSDVIDSISLRNYAVATPSPAASPSSSPAADSSLATTGANSFRPLILAIGVIISGILFLLSSSTLRVKTRRGSNS